MPARPRMFLVAVCFVLLADARAHATFVPGEPAANPNGTPRLVFAANEIGRAHV